MWGEASTLLPAYTQKESWINGHYRDTPRHTVSGIGIRWQVRFTSSGSPGTERGGLPNGTEGLWLGDRGSRQTAMALPGSTAPRDGPYRTDFLRPNASLRTEQAATVGGGLHANLRLPSPPSPVPTMPRQNGTEQWIHKTGGRIRSEP